MIRTCFEIVIDHEQPLDVEQLGQMLSNATRNVPNALPLKGNIRQVVIVPTEWNGLFQ